MTETGRSALIGHTGFVGSNLARQRTFDDCFNSSTIADSAGRRYDLVVCAGARAEKWKANHNPESDWKEIAALIAALERIEARKVILISTVDVYPVPRHVDEATPIDRDAGHAYGRHRLALEDAVVQRFDTTVIRLPGLFGVGLKKNVIYDLLHDNQTDRIDSRAVFQFYYLDTLWADIASTLAAELPVANFATEPVSVGDVSVALERPLEQHVVADPPQYDMWTRHARALGGEGHYVQSRAQVLESVRSFGREERARLQTAKPSTP